MAEGITACFIFGVLFWYLAIRSYRKSARWRGAVRLLAVVTSVQYREAWERKTEINDHKSTTEAALCFADQGMTYERRRQFSGIVHAPAPGQRIPILFVQDSGSWILQKEVRPHWRLFLALGCLCTLVGLLLVLDGRKILSDLACYRVEAPNPAGSIVCMLIGLICGVSAYACIRGLMLELIRTAAEPFIWIIRFYVLHRYEEVNALCTGIIRRESGDDDVSYYPFFQYMSEGGQSHWFPKRQMARRRFQPGNSYTLYRDSETGRCALKPSVLDLASSFFSLIPIGFFVMLILSLLACAVGSLYIAGLGFVYALAE